VRPVICRGVCSVDFCIPLLVQQNLDRSSVFNRSWAEYKVGFNDSRGNYWLGNDLLSQLTLTGRYKLRFDLQSRTNTSNWYSAEYSSFRVQPESDNYRLQVSRYSGNAGRVSHTSGHDSLSWQNGMEFTTFDRDNDQHLSWNCAAVTGGGFWHKDCCYCCVNSDERHFNWYGMPGVALQSSRMWLQCK